VGLGSSANLRVFIGWRGSVAELIHELMLYTNLTLQCHRSPLELQSINQFEHSSVD
jgi:hypothetical protein